jgi:hypothetical protein
VAIIGFTIHGDADDDRHSHGGWGGGRPPKDMYFFRAEADGRRLRKVN